MQITKKNVAKAKRVYWWLLLAPLIAFPCWLLTGAAGSGPGDLWLAIFSAGVPLIFYIPIFFWAFSNDAYLRAHARQGALLLMLRFTFAVLIGFSAMWGFLLCNGLLWFIGNIAGLVQASHGRCWIGNIRAEIVKDSVMRPQEDKKGTPTTTPSETESVESYLKAFRTGDASARETAVRKLEALGQVETF
jgi:hypothetical protein